jgi:protein phosphatase
MSYRDASPLTRLRVAARTDVGRVRAHNEDTFFVADLSTRETLGPEPVEWALESTHGAALSVVDGMGGHSMGEPAARILSQALAAALTMAPPSGEDACRRRLVAAMTGASRTLFEAALRDVCLTGSGGAAVLAVVQGDRLHLASAGDSRVYLLRAGRLVQVTRDDSLLNHWYALGGPATGIAEIPANVLTKALGLAESLEITPATFALCAGDVILLASDGLNRMVADPVIEQVLRDLPDPAEACLALVNLAVSNRADDNVTVIVARPDGAGLRPPGAGDVLESRNVPGMVVR